MVWVSKLRALYCIESLIKTKKFFKYFKQNNSILNDFGLEKIQQENPQGFKNIDTLLS